MSLYDACALPPVLRPNHAISGFEAAPAFSLWSRRCSKQDTWRDWMLGSDAVWQNLFRNIPHCHGSACFLLPTNWVCKTTHLTRHTGSNERKERKWRPPESSIAFGCKHHPVSTWRNLAQYDFHPGTSFAEDFVGCSGSWADFYNHQEAEAGAESALTRRCEEGRSQDCPPPYVGGYELTGGICDIVGERGGRRFRFFMFAVADEGRPNHDQNHPRPANRRDLFGEE